MDRDLVGYADKPPRVTWPHGARVAISLVVNYEEGSENLLQDGVGRRESLGEAMSPVPPDRRDLALESMFEYGSRVGVWRFLRIFAKYGVRSTFFACAVALERNPAVARAITEQGHDVCGHGNRWEEYYLMDRETERRAIHEGYAGIERTFILVMVMFALLAVTGPILHFTHRQRQREVIDYKPPRWAPVVALNTPEPRVRAMQTPNPAAAYRPARRAAPQPDQTDWRPAPHRNQNRNPSPIPTPDPRPVPSPARPPDPNERLRHALQQLVDRIQTIQPTQPNAAPGRTRRADIEMLKNAQ